MTGAPASTPSVSLEGQVAIVTGAGRGLGRAYALELARRGASLVVNDLGSPGESVADDVVSEISRAGGTAVAAYGSVATVAGGQAVVQSALDRFGTIDVVVNNAGILRNGFVDDLSATEIDEVLDVHLRGSFFVTQPAFRTMRAKGYGRFVNISSNVGAFGMAGLANYAAAKAGVLGLTRAVAIEGEPHGILANSVLPTGRTTISGANPIPGLSERFHAVREVMEPRSKPETVAPLVAYLASPACTVTGEIFSACAGRFARVFVGLAQGWLGDDADAVTAEDIATHLEEIRGLDDFVVPRSMLDEYENVVARLPG